MTLEELADLVLNQQDQIDKLIGQNMALRTTLLALIVSHPDKTELVQRLEQMSESAIAKSLYGAAQDASIDEAARVLAELARPWRDPQAGAGLSLTPTRNTPPSGRNQN